MDLFSREKGLFLYVSFWIFSSDMGKKWFYRVFLPEYLFPKNLNVKKGYVFLVSTIYIFADVIKMAELTFLKIIAFISFISFANGID